MHPETNRCEKKGSYISLKGTAYDGKLNFTQESLFRTGILSFLSGDNYPRNRCIVKEKLLWNIDHYASAFYVTIH